MHFAVAILAHRGDDRWLEQSYCGRRRAGSDPHNGERAACHLGAGVGPQTPQDIFDENRALFEEIVADRNSRWDVSHGVVVVSEADLDM